MQCHPWCVHTSELDCFRPAERWALVRDGHAIVTEGIVCVIDSIPGPGLRLNAHLSTDVSEAVAIEQSALWVHGVIDHPPRELAVAGLHGTRLYVDVPRARVRELNIGAADCTQFGNKLVTSAVRTAADIARYSPDDEPAVRNLIALSNVTNYNTEQALEIVGRTAHLPFARRARHRLRAALAHSIGVVDPIDSPNGIEETLEVTRVAHLKHKPVESQALGSRGHSRRQNIDVILGQNTRDI